MSIEYCRCNRRITRALAQESRLGGFCPTCELRFDTGDLDSEFDSSDLSADEDCGSRQRVYQHRRVSPSHSNGTNVYDTVESSSDSEVDISTISPLLPTMDQLTHAFENVANSMGEVGRFKTPPFRGTKDENINAFFNKFDRFCAANRKDYEYKSQTIPLHFDGRAFAIYETFPDHVKDDYDSIVEHMKNYFEAATLPPLQAFEKLHTLKKGSLQTVQEF